MMYKRDMRKSYFKFGASEMTYLSERDPALGLVIGRAGRIRRPVTPDIFEALISSIIGQQISSKAAATVRARMQKGLGLIAPETIIAAGPGQIQSFGMSVRKAEYIVSAANSVAMGELDLAKLRCMDDHEIFEKLCAIKGIGKWTAEMLMLFSLQRPDVLSHGDLGIRRGLCMLHRHREITPRLYEKYRKLYSPHGSVASLYLWHIAGGFPV